jgi:Type VI secretion system/phage-baseplate injector OB domain
MNGQGPPFYGKYRGVVTDNADLLMLGRIRAKVQDVLGDNESGWALPSSPYAGDGVGLFLIPPKDALVWIEFEHGDPDYPIWSGCFWSEGHVPMLQAPPLLPNIKVLKTDSCTVTLDDTPGIGGITIESTVGLGAKIVMNVEGIEISSGIGSIKLSASGVSINDGALEVI